MIESRFWRKKLRKSITTLRRKRKFNRWSERKMVLFERELMLCAFQIRTLLERPKVSIGTSSKKLSVYRHKVADVSALTRAIVGPDDQYNWGEGESVEMNSMYLCNQLIHHHHMFAISEGEFYFKDVIFTSDFKKNKYIYKVSTKKLINHFALFSKKSSGLDGEGVVAEYAWDSESGEYTLTVTEKDGIAYKK